MDPLTKIGYLRALLLFMTDAQASIGGRAFVLFTVIYVVSPIDAFPEAIFPFIGWLDDLGLASIALMYLYRVLEPYRVGEKPQRG